LLYKNILNCISLSFAYKIYARNKLIYWKNSRKRHNKYIVIDNLSSMWQNEQEHKIHCVARYASARKHSEEFRTGSAVLDKFPKVVHEYPRAKANNILSLIFHCAPIFCKYSRAWKHKVSYPQSCSLPLSLSLSPLSSVAMHYRTESNYSPIHFALGYLIYSVYATHLCK
jgi:hypothetical protein